MLTENELKNLQIRIEIIEEITDILLTINTKHDDTEIITEILNNLISLNNKIASDQELKGFKKNEIEE